MDVNTLENIREAVHIASLVTLCLVVLVGALGMFKPQLLRVVFREFTERKYILAVSVFACLLSGTVFTATQSMMRPYDSSQPNISNTSGSLEQPNRQVFGENGEETEEASGRSDISQSEEVLGTSQTDQNSQPQKARQPVPSQNQSDQVNPPQIPASAATQTPPKPQPKPKPEKECKTVSLRGLCI